MYEGIQNMPLWHKDYFELKTFRNQQIRKRLSLHSPYLPKSTAFQKNSTITNCLLGEASHIKREREEKSVVGVETDLSKTKLTNFPVYFSVIPHCLLSCEILSFWSY